VRTITNANLNELSKTSTMLIEFSSQNCAPCKMQKEILTGMEGERSDVVFGNVNIEDEYSLVDKFKINSVPTIVVMKDGKESDRFVGLHQESSIANAL